MERVAAPGSAAALAALYGEATTWALRRPDEDFEKAAVLFREVIEQAPTNSLAAWSWLALARIQSLPADGVPADLPQQVKAYQEVIDRFPFSPAGEEAFLMQQSAKLVEPDTGRAEEVKKALEGFIQTHPQSPWRSAAHTLVAHCCAVLGKGEERLAAVIESWKTQEIDPSNSIQDWSWTYWQIAALAEFEAGDFATAREYYRKLINEYPSEQKVFLAKQELRRMDDLEARLRAGGTVPR